jgi:hypothetical protein
MATFTTSNVDGSFDGKLFTYTLTTADPAGDAFEYLQHVDLCFQAVGTWGGATLTAQGSNNGTDWFSLTNASGGAAITFTADGGKQSIERPRFIRPNLTVVGAGATVVVTVMARRNPLSR